MTNTTHISVRGVDETPWIDSMLAFFGLARRSRVDDLEEELEQVTNDFLESLSENEDLQLQVANLQAQLREAEPLIAKERLDKLKTRSVYRDHLNSSQIDVHERSDRN